MYKNELKEIVEGIANEEKLFSIYDVEGVNYVGNVKHPECERYDLVEYKGEYHVLVDNGNGYMYYVNSLAELIGYPGYNSNVK